MKVISEDTFSKFVRNELTKEKMNLAEKELISTGTANAVFSTLLSNYMESQDVDDILGVDEEVEQYLSEQKKIFSEICKKLEKDNSIMSNNLKFKNMENINLTKEELQKVTERYNSLKDSYDNNVSLKDNMLNAYLAARPDADKEKAEELVGKLLDGCDKLTSMYNEALEKGDFDVRKEIDALGKDMSVEDRFHLIVNTLVVVEKINLSTYSSMTNAKEEVEKAIKDYLEATPDPTQADCDAMLDALADAIKNNTIVLAGVEKAQEMLNEAKNGDAAIIDFASAQYDDATVKAMMALAMWLEFEDGNLPSMPAEVTPEMVGVGAATAVEEAKIASDVATGRKTVDVAVKCLKILGGVALACLLLYICINITIFVGGMIMLGLMSLLGTSVVATIVAMIIAIAAMWKTAELGTDAGFYIMEKAGKVYDLIVEKLRETVIPAIRKGVEALVKWIKNILGSRPTNIVATN